MKIAFLIAAHTYPELLARLVSRLQSPRASVFVHLDKDADMRTFSNMLSGQGIRGVHWVPRVRSRWGTFGQVRAALSLLKAALVKDKEADMFVFLSGQDYPLQTPEAMAGYFETRRDISFIKCVPMPWSMWTDDGGFERLTHFHFAFGSHRLEYPSNNMPGPRRLRLVYNACKLLLPKRRHLPGNVVFYGGFNWWNLTRKSVESVFDYLRRNPGFPKIFRFTRSSDEIFFQTILMNAKGNKLENNDLRCVFWDRRRNEYPAVVRMEDFDEIRTSGMFFTRKAHPLHSLDLLNRIDRELLSRT
jgi:hypothetical protein